MNVDIREQIRKYRQAMSLAKAMLERGIITTEEYGKIDKIMTNKYGVNSSTIYR
ncbi:MAG: hypothetical protein K5768_09240 [Firmicutes bacterium]|jgi:hypothetical protein|nr:hypothetical protein [Bacillota bacterium]